MFIKRSNNGGIELVSGEPTVECCESIATDSPELLLFMEQDQRQHLHQLRSSDLDFVRVLEDVVELLLAKGVISFTELPEAAREKWLSRQSMRRQANSVDLLDDDENGII